MPDVFIDFIEISPSQKKAIAEGITDIFCELAGCKPNDVHTRFRTVDYFVGGNSVSNGNINSLFAEGADPSKQPNFRIDVQLFPGRPKDLLQQIADRMGAMIEKTYQFPANKVEMQTSDLHNRNLFVAGGVDWIPAPAQS